MDTAAAARRLSALQSHLQGYHGHVACDIEMQDCAAFSATAFARPAACDTQYARAERHKGEMRQQEVALWAAENVLGSSLIPVDATAAHKSKVRVSVQAPPAFAKATGDDARITAAVADAHEAFEHSLRAAARPPARPQRTSRPKSAEAMPPAFSHTARRGAGLRADALQSSTCHTLQVALPGVRAEDLRVEVNGRRLTISGRRPLVSFIRVHGKSATPSVHHQDHGLPPKPKSGYFTSTWRLPADADTSRASAELDNGVLRITFSRNF